MAFMHGSPVLTDDRFGREAQAGGGYGTTGATMTINGTITALGVLMVLLVGSAMFGWSQVNVERQYDRLGRLVDAGVAQIPSWTFVAMLVALGFGLATTFVPKIARITAPLYALAMGAALGAISGVYNYSYNGIVTQAVFATLGIFTAMFVLYATRIIKVTNRFVMIVAGATLGIMVMYLFAWAASMFGAQVTFFNDGSPLAILISVGIIVIAALNLAIDFAFIEKASQHGVPKYMEWYGAYGIVVTLVWIYLEVLRLLAMLNRR